MSDPPIDQLAEAARNRGLKLARSRVRTEGKRRFGKVGLTDKSGRPVFGMDAKGPAAKPEEVQQYLRTLDAKDWGASLDVAAPQRKRTGKTPARPRGAANDASPTAKSKPRPKPKPIPQPAIREARPVDVPRLAGLMKLLGHDVSLPAMRNRLAVLKKQGMPQLVATIGKEVVGLIGIHRMTAIHREQPVGRITILVVAENQRGKGIGKLLLEAAENQLASAGCTLIEVTSNDRLTAAHRFYRHMGYERTSIRFAKTL
jgi:ribosomal protein S18 acetylase RimI-like enzyme